MKRALWFLMLAAAVPAVAQQSVDQRRPAEPDGRVVIDNQAGSIRVIGWDQNEVAVKGTLGRAAEGLAFKASGARTEIEVETRGNPHSTKSDLEIHAPAGSQVEIDSFSASISVSGIKGRVRAESVNASIMLSSVSGEVDAQTVNGGVEVSGASARVHAESVNGAVMVRGAKGEVEASTVNGTLTVSGGSFERGHLETVSGSIEFEGDLAGKGWLDVESVSGDVELRLPAGVSAEFSVSSFSGDIENQLGPPARKTSRFTSQREVDFMAGAGGMKVSVKTLSGEIRLLKR